MGFLTRLLAGLTAAAALGAGLTGTANAVDVTGATGNTKSVVKLAADDTNNLPDHIVNGNFDISGQRPYARRRRELLVSSARTTGSSTSSNVDGSSEQRYKPVPRAGTRRNSAGTARQTGDTDSIRTSQRADARAGRLYADRRPNQPLQRRSAPHNPGDYHLPGHRHRSGTSCTSGASKHASLDCSHLDKMQRHDRRAGQGDRRRKPPAPPSNGHGDTARRGRTAISTKVCNPEMRTASQRRTQWETYTGTYDRHRRPSTRFTFRSVAGTRVAWARQPARRHQCSTRRTSLTLRQERVRRVRLRFRRTSVARRTPSSPPNPSPREP